jgi:hypothetical protein
MATNYGTVADMANVHHLILKHGADTARSMAMTKADILAVNAAAAILSGEETRLGITHAGFALTALPHKRIAEPLWKRQGLNTVLLVETGRDREGAAIGIPFGSLARMILLYLQTQAIRTGSPEIELGGSMKAWMERMGLQRGGQTYQGVAEQARRISSCRLTFFTDGSGGAELRENSAFVREAISMMGVVDEQPRLWQDRVRLDDGFWRSLQAHPVPVREEAIQAISTRSMAIDLYIWLAYRLHSLSKPTPITWASLYAQFGAGFRLVRQMKPKLLESLHLALAVYPEAHVDVTETGICLYPSPPAVPRAEAKRLGLT